MARNLCLILDFGSAQSRSVARKLRGEKVYCEILPAGADVERIKRIDPRGLILVGDPGAPAGAEPAVDEGIYALGIPMLGFGLGAGLLLRREGARLVDSLLDAQAVEVSFDPECALFKGISDSERMLERLDLYELPEGMKSVAKDGSGACVAFENREKKLYGLQFFPEQNDPDGLSILYNFAVEIAGCEPDWTIERFCQEETESIRAELGEGSVLAVVSGGVDSAACAALLYRALGSRLSCLHVDTGLLRAGEFDLAEQALKRLPGLMIRKVDASQRILGRLKGASDSTEKREIVAEEMCRIFDEELEKPPRADCLAEGTVYDDMLGLEGLDEPHGLRRRTRFPARLGESRVIEPVGRLFKEEIRGLASFLELPEALTQKQAFPGPGLALRCLGEVTEYKLKLLREADAIFTEEIAGAGLDRRVKQFFCVLLNVRTADMRYGSLPIGYTVALRAVNRTGVNTATAYRLPYDLLERVAERLTGEIQGVNRVVYDITGKPPAGIEWD